MKLVSFVASGTESFGIWKDTGIVDAGARLRDYKSLRSLLADPEPLQSLISNPVDYLHSDVELLPPVPDANRVIGIGLNYKAHIAETDSETPRYPMLFPRYQDSLIGSGACLVRPTASDHFDYEGELAVVIGTAGRRISVERAMEHVAGYACFNDGSIRDFQKHSSQVIAGKNFFHSGSFGPYLVTPDEAGEVRSMRLETRVNGRVVQDSSLDDLLFSVSELISYVSQMWEVMPGDVIATGTPSGIGARRSPPLWLRPNDVLEVEITRLGILSNSIVGEEEL